MKKIISLLLFIMVMAVGIQARTFVLCVGVSNYDDNDMNLSQTTKDAKHFKSVMEQHTKDITILTSRYAAKSNILEKMRAICNRAGKGDKIIFFFSGHGYSGGVVAHDEILSYQEINDVLSQSEASAKICFVDACHAGSVAGVRDESDGYEAPVSGGIIYMMSCRADEYSVENAWVGHGFFSQAVLKGIRGKADANRDKKISVRELFNYVYNDVQHTTSKMEISQHPQLIGAREVADAILVDWN